MRTIPFDEIIIGSDRQRREFDPKRLQELADSIESKGLLHPVVLRIVEGSDEGFEYHLVAGERRCRAVQLLDSKGKALRHDGRPVPAGEIPFTLLEELSEDLQVEAEFEENVVRVDLTPVERALAIKKLHDLRTKQKGGYDASASQFLGEQVGHTVRDTAREVHGDKVGASGEQDIRDALLIAQHADDPEVAAAKSQAEAVKIIRKTHEARQRKAKAEAFDPSKTPHRLYHGNTYDPATTRELQKTFDIVITDPPYGIDIDKTTGHEYEDSDEVFAQVIEKLPGVLDSVTKDQAHIYVFCDYMRFNELFAAFELQGFECWRRPLIWDKGNVGSFGNIEYGFRKTYECILFANKGKKRMQIGGPEVLNFAPVAKPSHPAEKPVELLVELLRRSASTGDFVLDCYAGSGAIFEAASKATCIAYGIELDPKFHAVATNRLQLLTGQITSSEVEVKLDDLI